MKKLTIHIPDTIDFDEREALMAIASKLFERGKLTLGQAATLVGLSKGAFMELLSTYGVSLFNQSISDLDNDVEEAKNYNI